MKTRCVARSRWTYNEVEVLKHAYNVSLDKNELKTLLPDRNWTSILTKAKSLGLSEKYYKKTQKNEFRYDENDPRVAYLILTRKNGTRFETTVDVEDLTKILSHPYRWCLTYKRATRSFYVQSKDTNGTTIFLHRFLTNAKQGEVVDHINYDTLDNRRSCNLRNISHSENFQNRKETYRGNKSTGLKNISWNESKQRYIVKLFINGRSKYFGSFKKDEFDKAIECAKSARAEYFPFSSDARIRACN